MKRRMVLLLILLKYCFQKKMPVWNTYKCLREVGRERREDVLYLIQIDYLNNQQADSFVSYNEYVDISVQINGVEAGDLLDNKTTLYKRCPHLLGRECLVLTECTEEQKLNFIKGHRQFVGKRNYGRFAQQFSCYDTSKQSVEEILKGIQENKQVLLEEYIVQHEKVSQLYPHSVNTIRLHTMNNGEEVRMFLKPKMRLGANGSVVDANGTKGSYRLLLNLDGTVEMAVQLNKWSRAKQVRVHHDTGAELMKVQIPYVEEAIALVKEAAMYFPELPYIGWDVAITPKGPVIVEGNYISGATSTYQIMKFFSDGIGIRQELEKMLAFCTKGKSLEEK